jgi:hypothetical protein
VNGVDVGVAAVRAGLGTTALFLVGPAGAGIVVIAAVGFGLEWFVFAYVFARWVNGTGVPVSSVEPAPAGFDPARSVISVGAPVAAPSRGCAPAVLTSAPDGRWLLLCLLPIQLLLGLMVARRRVVRLEVERNE